MTLWDCVRTAVAALRRNALRSVLTTLGIVIGVASVIIMVAVGSGARQQVEQQISTLGSNTLMVFPGSSRVGGRQAGAGTDLPLSEEDMAAIAGRVPEVVAITGSLGAAVPVIFGNTNWTTTLTGVHADYLAVRDWPLVLGRPFSPAEVRSAAKVAILGKTPVDKLFGGASPLGGRIRIRKVPFTVVGVLEAKGQSMMGRDQDDVVLVPITTARSRIIGRNSVVPDQVGTISVKFEPEADLSAARADIEKLLRRRRNIPAGGEDDFFVRNLADFIRARTATQNTMGLLLGATAAISLLVGGIGIMNIMLVSVTERTREIGLRMAVGAKRREILLQFLVEAVTLSCVGGAIGLFLGCAIAIAVAVLADWPVVIGGSSVAIAILAASLVGTIFGYFPARRAASLKPIEALRFE